MERVLRLVGKTSNEIFLLRFPQTITGFCEYDLTYFVENAIEVCNEALKNGELDIDRMTEIRNSLKNLHPYVEHHIRTIYDKIVLDCWIDYVCRRDNVGTGSLWNRFLSCKTPFEKLVFTRLCEFRYNRAINEWLNLVRVQDYAKNKVSFIFSRNLKGAEEAAARRNYFDLIFSVTAKELGCRIEDMSVTKIFSVGRVPTAPYMFPNISKSIVKNVLADFDYSEDYSNSKGYGDLSDQIAMDAFLHMKAGLEGEYGSYNISDSKMAKNAERVYMPLGLKAAVDLEIDALLEAGAWLARCKRCGRYFPRDAEHMEEYCSLRNPGGKTCLEIYEIENPKPKFPPELDKRCGEITDEMYGRVDKTMSLSEYQKWKAYLEAMRRKVENSEIPAEELEAFINYSKTLDLTRSHPVEEVPKKPREAGERVVKPFVPERVYRRDIEQPQKPPADPEEEHTKREGFFTSPTVQRQKNERAPISHIIRAGEQRGGENSAPANTFMPFGEHDVPQQSPRYPEQNGRESAYRAGSEGLNGVDPRGGAARSADNSLNRAASGVSDSYVLPNFAEPPAARGNVGEAFNGAARGNSESYNYPEFAEGAPAAEDHDRSLNNAASSQSRGYNFPDFADRAPVGENRGRPLNNAASSQSGEYNYPDFADRAPVDENRGRPLNNAALSQSGGYNFPDFSDRASAEENRGRPLNNAPSSQSGGYNFPDFADRAPVEDNRVRPLNGAASAPAAGYGSPDLPENRRNGAGSERYYDNAEPDIRAASEDTTPPKPAPKIIRKNAAAISAYGKMAGTLTSTAPEFEQFTRPEPAEPPQINADPDPFKDVGSIFDVLEQSESDMSGLTSSRIFEDDPEPAAEPVSAKPEPPAPVPVPKPQPAADIIAEDTDEPAPEWEERAPVTAENAPSGIWTEERRLFPEAPDEDDQSELAMLKERKRAKSNKTQRLFDAIMREPDDNPNFRRR